MKRGTRVYMKSAPYRGVGTVIWVMGMQITVRWDMKGLIRNHPVSVLQQVGVPVQ